MTKKKATAQYVFTTDEKEGVKFLLIIDMNAGGKSVTNDIENVVADIQETKDIKDHVILYQDSEGDWDGWNSDSDTFFHVGGKSADEVMDNYIGKYKTAKK